MHAIVPFSATLMSSQAVAFRATKGRLSMQGVVAVVATLLFAVAATAFCDETVALKIRVVLVDAQLNQKPVPRFALSLQRPGESSPAYTTRTGFDGVAEASVTPGAYQVTSVDPLTFEGKDYRWTQAITIGSAMSVDLSNDNAVTTSAQQPSRPARVIDELATQFGKLKNSVVTVWSETGHGTGFLVDENGLVLTNEHVVGGSDLLSVQFDQKRKVRATVLASNAERDVAVLRISPGVFDGAVIAPIAKSVNGEPVVVEGERVFTIGSPLHQRKIITSGIVSKIEPHAIITDVNINHGNSGGPLFNSFGEVIGITTFGDLPLNGGPGISGVVRIDEAIPLLDAARQKLSQPPPEATLLPVEPADAFPLDAIKAAITADKFNVKPYTYGIGGFDVAFATPVVVYRLRKQAEMEAVKGKNKRNRRSVQAVQNTFDPVNKLRGWEEYIGEYKPELIVEVKPQLREGFWSAFGRGLAASRGMYGGPANMAFQTDFYRMKLLCGGKEVEPIQPAKSPIVLNEENPFIRVKDATYEGAYFYPYDAISPKCGTVVLKLFSEKKPNEPIVLLLNGDTVQKVWNDFEPYREQLTRNTPEHVAAREQEQRGPTDLSSQSGRREALDTVVREGMTMEEVNTLVGRTDDSVGKVIAPGVVKLTATYATAAGKKFVIVFTQGIVTSVSKW